MGSRYWEATGSVRAKLVELSDKSQAVGDEMLAFARANGGDKIGMSRSGFGAEFVVVFRTPPDLKLWKPVKGADDQYRPVTRSKAGKELGKQMDEIARRMPSGLTVANAIGMDCMSGGAWYTPGYSCIGERVLVSTPDHFEPKGDKAKELERISDVEFERLTAKKAKK